MESEKKYTLKYDWFVIHKDIPSLDAFWRTEIRTAVAEKLTSHPELFGKPLRQSLSGWRSLRVGDYRVVYQIRREIIYILGIIHRSEVYKEIEKRLGL